jgi:23S rRNA pseudouridine1911/1915/1917 synthase
LTFQQNQGWIYREQVPKSGADQTVLQYYSQKYRHSTETQWREKIIAGQIFLNGDRPTPETKLKSGQHLEYHRPPWCEPAVPLDYKVLYEDEDLMAINKPGGLPVLPGGNFLQHTLWWQLQQDYPHHTPVPVHRLGRGTSGLMLLARSHLAKSVLSQQMRANSRENKPEKEIIKVYRTLVTGNSIPDQLTIRDRIGKIPHPTLGYIYGATPAGKFALSQCQVLQRYSNSTLVEVTILTGRPHQIRIHLAAAGYPLLGDPLYLPGGIPKLPSATAKTPLPGDCGYHLHAYRLCFNHPRSGVKMDLKCSLSLNIYH